MAKDLKMSVLLDLYGEMLTQKQRMLVDYYYNEDLSLSEISANEGITRQGVRDGIKRAEGQLYAYEEKLGLADKLMHIGSMIDEIKICAQRIKASDNNKADLTDRIISLADKAKEAL